MQTCKDCGGPMLQGISFKSWCKNECDLPLEARSRDLKAVAVFPAEPYTTVIHHQVCGVNILEDFGDGQILKQIAFRKYILGHDKMTDYIDLSRLKGYTYKTVHHDGKVHGRGQLDEASGVSAKVVDNILVSHDKYEIIITYKKR